ncbi:hypothetical protein RCL1_002860 [Eukaryota sp. TZLM3-RCL]
MDPGDDVTDLIIALSDANNRARQFEENFNALKLLYEQTIAENRRRVEQWQKQVDERARQFAQVQDQILSPDDLNAIREETIAQVSATYDQKLHNLTQELASTRDTHSSLERQFKIYRAEAESRIQNLETNLSAERSSHEDTQRHLASLRQSLRESQVSMGSSSRQLPVSKVCPDCEALNTKVSIMRDQISELQIELESKDEDIVRLENQIIESRQHQAETISLAKRERMSLDSKLSELESITESLRSSKDDVSKKNDQLRRQNSDLLESLKREEIRRSELERQNFGLCQTLKSEEQSEASLRDQICNLEAALNDSVNKYKELQLQNQTLSESLNKQERRNRKFIDQLKKVELGIKKSKTEHRLELEELQRAAELREVEHENELKSYKNQIAILELQLKYNMEISAD